MTKKSAPTLLLKVLTAWSVHINRLAEDATCGVLTKYAKSVSSASLGAVTDNLN
ncbi:hypothetical protein [Methylobacter sp. BlB1]|uniref:hypothetical protein n=1 Tax=Methylobacter sp. BlB1 TaxID=2785914 RepID=UPI001892F831|nr:hypothetical protein [Methylobacter sp. BlB1]MBF6647597.1 hypothetical protein [Methylobacter sp. BlB1]